MAKTIFLEFERQDGGRAALGSDATYWIDGRWGGDRRLEHIRDRVKELRSRPGRFRDLKFVGYCWPSSDPNARLVERYSFDEYGRADGPVWAQEFRDLDGVRWRWLEFRGMEHCTGFAQAYDKDGEELVDWCWQWNGDLTWDNLRHCAWAFHDKYPG